MSFALGTAVGRIVLDYDGSGADEAKKDVEGLKKSSGSTSKALGTVSKVTAVAGAAIAAGLAVAVNSAANFEQRISGISAVSGETGKGLDDLRNKALQLGKDTQYSAGEAAQAIEELVKAGISTEDVLNGAADAAVNLAAAGEISIPEAATIAANSMNQFSLAAKDLPGVADAIAGAANSSAIDVSDFGQSLTQVGAVANLAGVSFEDTATAIALLGNAGIKGSDAGTSLKSMFSRLQPTTTKAYNEMENLGLISFSTNKAMGVLADNGIQGVTKANAALKLDQLTADLSDSEVGSAKAAAKYRELGLQTGFLSNKFYDAQGNTKGLRDVSEELSKSLEGMNARQKQAALQTLFGSDAIRAAAILAKNGASGFDKLAASIGKTSAADVAKTRMDNLKGSLEQMKGSLETAGIALGTILLPGLRKIVDALTQALNWFLGLSDGMQKFVAIALVTIAAVLLVVAAVIKIVLVAGEVTKALQVLKLAFAETWVAALGPIALIIAAVLAFIAIFVILYKKNETFRNIVNAVWNGVKSVIMSVVNWFKGVPGYFTTALNAIQSAFGTAVEWVKSHWMLLVGIILGPLGIIIGLVMHFWPQIKALFSAGLNALLAPFRAAWALFGPIVRAAFGLIMAIIKLAWVIIKGIFLLSLMVIKNVVHNVLTGIAVVFRAVFNVIRNIVSAGMNAARSVISAVMNAIRAVFNTVWNAIAAVIRAVWSRIGGTVMAGVDRVKSVVTGAWNAVKAATSAVWNAIVDSIRTAVGKVTQIAGTILSNILGALSGAASYLYTKGQEIIQGLIDGIASKISAVTDKIKSITSAISSHLPGSPVKEGPLKVLNDGYAGKQIVQMVIDGMTASQTNLVDATDTVAGTIPRGVAPVNGRGGRISKQRGGGTAGHPMEIHGTLDITPNGKAVLTGIAVGAVNDDDDYDDTLGRMN